MDAPDFLQKYYALLKSENHGQNDDERLDFCLTLAVKSIQYPVLFVDLCTILSDERMRATGAPRNPITVSPMSEIILQRIPNRSEVERLIAETNCEDSRLIFTRVEPQKLILDNPSLSELLQCSALAAEVGAMTKVHEEPS